MLINLLLKRLLQSNVAVAIVEASPGCLGEHRSGEAGSSCLVGPGESGIHGTGRRVWSLGLELCIKWRALDAGAERNSKCAYELIAASEHDFLSFTSSDGL